MPQRLSLLGLLGVADLDQAAALWPSRTFLPGLGLSATIDDPGDYVALLAYLDTAVSFVNVRPGAGGDELGAVGLVAEMVIDPHPDPSPLVLRQLPDIGFVLLANSASKPARVFATQSDRGVEVVVEGLPVEIHLPNGLLGPLRSEQDELLGPALTDVTQAGPFQAGDYDTFEVVLSEQRSSLLRVHLRVRLTTEGEVTIEPAVPISIGPCRFSGLPCDAVHDLGLLPYPELSGAHTSHELALEWARHRIPGGLGIDGTGLITIRTLDLAHGRDPLRGIVERIATPGMSTTESRPQLPVEFVLEDLALPVSSWLTPVATHGRFGLRRNVIELGDEAEPYDMSLAPITIEIGGPIDWQLKIFRLLFESPATVVARLAVVFGNDDDESPSSAANDDHAMVIDVSDGWLLQGTWSPPHPRQLFEVANIGVSVMAIKLGVLLRDISEAQGLEGWAAHMRALVDIGISVGDDDQSFFTAKLDRPPGAELGQDVVLRDLGWDLGEPRFFPNLWFPEDLEFTAFRVVQLEIEELAMLNEDNGGRYLAFSGGVSIFPGAGDPKRLERDPSTPGLPAEGQPDGGGIRFRRLRFRTGGNPEAPRWLLDGVTIFLRVGTFELSGFGTAVDHTRDGHRYREFGLGLFIAFEAMARDFSIGAQLYYGKVSGPVDNFTYWLFGAQLGSCPVGPYELRGISLLVASGMTPALPEPSGRPQEMRLLEWYRANRASGAVEVRSDRTQTRGGWRPEQGATAAAVGFDVGLSVSKNVLLRSFVFIHRSDTEFGVLVAVEVFILKGREPVGLGAIEIDTRNDRWSALIAVDLDFAQLLDTDSPLAKGLGTLTGSIFAGNKPGMFAIGQLADQSTWLTLAVDKSLFGMRARVSFGVCLQISERPGPRGFGFVASAAAEGNLGVGKVQLYASFGLLIGTWGNEASSSGVMVWAEVSLRIKVFYVFSFGASVKAIIEQLGPQQPNFRRASLEVRIETPWWLPDVTFRLTKVSGTASPEQMPVLSAPLVHRSRDRTRHAQLDRPPGDRDRRAGQCAHDRCAAICARHAARRADLVGDDPGEPRLDDRPRLRRLARQRDHRRPVDGAGQRAAGGRCPGGQRPLLALHAGAARRAAQGPVRPRRRSVDRPARPGGDGGRGTRRPARRSPARGHLRLDAALPLGRGRDQGQRDRSPPAAGQRRHAVFVRDLELGDRRGHPRHRPGLSLLRRQTRAGAPPARLRRVPARDASAGDPAVQQQHKHLALAAAPTASGRRVVRPAERCPRRPGPAVRGVRNSSRAHPGDRHPRRTGRRVRRHRVLEARRDRQRADRRSLSRAGTRRPQRCSRSPGRVRPCRSTFAPRRGSPRCGWAAPTRRRRSSSCGRCAIARSPSSASSSPTKRGATPPATLPAGASSPGCRTTTTS